MSTDSYVGVAPDSTGKKVATEQVTRSDGAVVEQQQVRVVDPLTGRDLDAPPWAELLDLQRAILVELRVLNTILADEARTDEPELNGLRRDLQEELMR